METGHSNSCPTPNGTLLVVGGHENKGEAPEKRVQQANYEPLQVLKKLVALTGKKDCVIEVITTASSEGEASFKDYLAAFTKIGLKQIGHIHHDKRFEAMGPEATARIEKADAVYFSGGNQLKLTAVYGGTTFLFRLKQRYIYDNLVIGGTSAGAMALSTPMIFAGNKEVEQLAGEVKITTGLEFLKDVCIDTHFIDRSRFVRMAQVIATNPVCIGIGIEEDTALIIRQGIETEVIGSGVVIVVEGFGVTDSNILDFGADEKISIHDLNVKVLAKGNRYTIPRYNPPHV